MELSYRDVKAVGETCQSLSSICETILESKRKVVEIRASWSNPNFWPPMEALLRAASLGDDDIDGVSYRDIKAVGETCQSLSSRLLYDM